MAEGINIGSIYADLDVNTGNLEQGLARGQQAMAAAEAEIKKLQHAYEDARLGEDEYARQSLELYGVMAQLEEKMRAASEAIAAGTAPLQAVSAASDAASASVKRLTDEQVSASAVLDAKANAYAVASGKIYAMADAYEVMSQAEARGFRSGTDKAGAEAIARGNGLLSSLTIQADAYQKLQRAEVDEATAKRQSANAAAGAAREQDYLNNLLREGASHELTASAATSTLASAKDKATDSSKRFGQGLVQVGYAADDLQYGIGGIINNVGPMVAAFGGAASAVGTIQLLAVAGNQLYKHWDDLLGLMGAGKIETEAEEMSRLGKATKTTADEAERLARYKALSAKTEELRGAQTESERTAEGTVTKAITEAGFRDVVGGVKSSVGDVEGDPEVIKAKKELAKARAGSEGYSGDVPVHIVDPEAIKAAQRKLIDAQEAYAEKFVSAAALMRYYGPEKLLEMVEDRPEEFGLHADYLKGELQMAVLQKAVDPEERNRKKADDAWRKVEKEMGDEETKTSKTNQATFHTLATWEIQDTAATARKNKQGLNEVSAWEKQDDTEQKRLKREKAAEDKKEASEAQRKGHEMLPGFKQMADVAAAQVESGRANLFDAHKALNAQLEKAGLSKEEAVKAGSEEFGDARVRVNDMAHKRRAGLAGENMPRSQSEVYSTSSLTDKIQSSIGVGGDGTKQVAANTQEMIKILQEIAKQKGLRIEVRK